MTKFEEKLEILPIKIIQHPVGNTKYYAAVHVKTLITQADEEIANLKSQLQQQALPVVPECVAVQIERVKNSNGNFATLGLFDWNHEAKPDYTKWINENVFDFMRACTIGYTVEKPQLFYLKNKLTGKYLRSYTGLSTDDTTLRYEDVENKKAYGFGGGTTFTQEEIDSMETGSYEQIEVAE